jgi:hypothetical protein
MRLVRIALSLILIFPSLLPASPRFHRKTQQTSATSSSATTTLRQSLVALAPNLVPTDVTLSGNARRIAGSSDESGTVTYRALPSGASRFDFNYASGTRTEVRPAASSGLAGARSTPDGVSHAIANHNLLADPGVFPAFAVGSLNSGANFVVTLVGQETKEGISVYHLSGYQQFPQMSEAAAAFVQHLTLTDIFLDSTTLLPVAIDFNTHPENDALVDFSVEILFSDYRLVNGVEVPFHVQKFLNNGLVLDLQFQSVALNSGLSAAVFQVQ